MVLRSASDGSLVFRGSVLEAVAGKSLDKRLEGDGGFCDVDYLVTLLQQVGGKGLGGGGAGDNLWHCRSRWVGRGAETTGVIAATGTTY